MGCCQSPTNRKQKSININDRGTANRLNAEQAYQNWVKDKKILESISKANSVSHPNVYNYDNAYAAGNLDNMNNNFNFNMNMNDSSNKQSFKVPRMTGNPHQAPQYNHNAPYLQRNVTDSFVFDDSKLASHTNATRNNNGIHNGNWNIQPEEVHVKLGEQMIQHFGLSAKKYNLNPYGQSQDSQANQKPPKYKKYHVQNDTNKKTYVHIRQIDSDED